jgi:hypothetical protein
VYKINIFKIIKEKNVKKLILLSFLTVFINSSAYAGFISTVTGADMAGMNVTVTYDDGTSESLIWEVISVGNGLTDTVNLETASGGVTGSGFTLYQQGNSLGNVDTRGTADLDDDILYGLWTLTNTSSALTITNLFIDALAGNVVFDTLLDTGAANGSKTGSPFDTPTSGFEASYSNQFVDELFGTMTVDLSLADGDTLIYFADTDLISVSAPTTLSLFLLTIIGIAARRKKV